MTTTSLTNKKRKIIDIPNDVFRFLSIKAAAQGTNLKIIPKSVIRLWGDCPLVSCSMLLA